LDQVAIAAILGLAWVAIAVGIVARGYHRGELIEVDQADPQTVVFRVDINRADWTELALLPDVGEVLARRIIESRERQGRFRAFDDLRRVRGIGPKTLDAIRPYLLPIPDHEAVVATPAGPRS
jgi:competence protein ComEA